MTTRTVKENTVYMPSDGLVSRDIEGELILIPIAAGVGDAEDGIFTLNETGRDIWHRLDGKRTLGQIAQDLAMVYSAPVGKIEEDVNGLVGELFRRKMIVQK